MNVEYAKRGIIGIINISSCVNLEPEFYAMAPKGVAILTDRISLPYTTPEELEKLSDKACVAAKELAKAKPDIIVFACTSGSFINGKGYDKEISKRLEQETNGIPVLTTTTAILEALEALKIHNIAFCSPYLDSVNQRAKKYFIDNGYNITAINGLGLETDYAIGLETEETVWNLANSVNSDQAEGIIISCTNLKTAPIIEKLEKELQKPIISANQATLWKSLRLIGINDQIPDLGKLMRI
jgi:maleate isomerase